MISAPQLANHSHDFVVMNIKQKYQLRPSPPRLRRNQSNHYFLSQYGQPTCLFKNITEILKLAGGLQTFQLHTYKPMTSPYFDRITENKACWHNFFSTFKGGKIFQFLGPKLELITVSAENRFQRCPFLTGTMHWTWFEDWLSIFNQNCYWYSLGKFFMIFSWPIPDL